MNVEIRKQNIKILFGNNEAVQFYFWGYRNRNHTHLYWILTGPFLAVMFNGILDFSLKDFIFFG